MNAIPLAHTNGSNGNGTKGAIAPQPWLQLSVQKFFAAFNWEDSPPDVQELKLSVIDGLGSPLSMTLTVKQFFGAISWDGNTIAAAPDPVEITPPSAIDNNFTLDNFSDLF